MILNVHNGDTPVITIPEEEGILEFQDVFGGMVILVFANPLGVFNQDPAIPTQFFYSIFRAQYVTSLNNIDYGELLQGITNSPENRIRLYPYTDINHMDALSNFQARLAGPPDLSAVILENQYPVTGGTYYKWVGENGEYGPEDSDDESDG